MTTPSQPTHSTPSAAFDVSTSPATTNENKSKVITTAFSGDRFEYGADSRLLPSDVKKSTSMRLPNSQSSILLQKLEEKMGDMKVRQNLLTGMADFHCLDHTMSPKQEVAFLELFTHPFASAGFDNAQHLGSVYKAAANSIPEGAPDSIKPLLVMETFLTDCFLKGSTENANIAPVKNPNGEGHLETAHQLMELLGQDPQGMMTGTLGHGFMSPEYASGALEHFVNAHDAYPNGVATTVDDMRTYLQKYCEVDCKGMDDQAVKTRTKQSMMEAVYGHHMTGFIAAYLSANGQPVMPDFDLLAEKSVISNKGKEMLKEVWSSAINLFSKTFFATGAAIKSGLLEGSNAAKNDHTVRTGDPSIAFNKPEHETLLNQYRNSIDLVQGNHIGRQLLADDVGQFEPDPSGVDSAQKWVGIALMDTRWDGKRPTNYEGLVENKLIGGIMGGYLGVSLARGTEHAKNFIDACNTMLQNVGYRLVYDENVTEVRMEKESGPTKDLAAMAIPPKLDNAAANKQQDLEISEKIANVLRNGFE